MKLTPPTQNVFWLSSVFTVLGLVALLVPAVSSFAIWIVLIGNILLWLSVTLKGF